MNYKNEDSTPSAHPSGYRHLPQPYPYSHYHYLVRSGSAEEPVPRIAKNAATAGNTQTVRTSEPPAAANNPVDGHPGASQTGGKGIHVDAGGELGVNTASV